MLAPVTSIAQILALTTPDGRQLARNWGQTRYTSGSGQTDYGPQGREHWARDVYLPPGSPVYTPVDGTWDHWGTSNEDGSTSMGYVGVLYGVDNITWRFVHIAVANRNAALQKGQLVPAGTLLGYTSLHNLGASASHLHLDATPGPKYDVTKRIDPIGALGVRGWNMMTTGRPGPADKSSVAGIVVKVAIAAAFGGLLFVGFAKFMRGRAPVDPNRLAP